MSKFKTSEILFFGCLMAVLLIIGIVSSVMDYNEKHYREGDVKADVIATVPFDTRRDSLSVICLDGYKYALVSGYHNDASIVQMFGDGNRPIPCEHSK